MSSLVNSLTRILLKIKRGSPWLWSGIELLNRGLFRLLHKRRFNQAVSWAIDEFELPGFQFRALRENDLPSLKSLLEKQSNERLKYFQPHAFDSVGLQRMIENSSFIMFGVFESQKLVGYFFLRCFWNRKCFVGRLIDAGYESRGIGRVMNQIMYHTAWRSGFRCMTTISKNNQSVMRSHSNNPHAKIVGELADDYILVEFVP